MSGPLTPPPTSATELMDQEKDAAASPAANPPAPDTTTATEATPVPIDPIADAAPPPEPVADVPTAPDYYQKQLVTLADFVAMGNYLEIIRVAELADLNVIGDERLSRLALIAPLVMAYLIRDELPPARSVFTRLPESIVPHPLAQGLFSLLSAAWARDYARAYARAEALYEYTKQDSFPSQDLATVMAAMLTAFVDAFRHRALVLVSKAYTSLSLTLAQNYLGLASAEQCVAELTNRGWTYDPTSHVLSHVPSTTIGSSVAMKGALATPSSLATFSFVTDAVARLEA